VKHVALIAVVASLATACGGSSSTQPKDDPSAFAVKVLGLITHNQYAKVWGDLHPADQKVAPLAEYVQCETANPVIAAPENVKVVSVDDESVGLGDGSFVRSKAVDVRMSFRGGFHVVHTVHVVAKDGKWTWILPPWRFRDYKADKCPSSAPSQSA
jgi:hypothetical protein